MLKATISLLSVAIISAFGTAELPNAGQGNQASTDASTAASDPAMDSGHTSASLDASHLHTLHCQGSSCDLGSALFQAFRR